MGTRSQPASAPQTSARLAASDACHAHTAAAAPFSRTVTHEHSARLCSILLIFQCRNTLAQHRTTRAPTHTDTANSFCRTTAASRWRVSARLLQISQMFITLYYCNKIGSFCDAASTRVVGACQVSCSCLVLIDAAWLRWQWRGFELQHTRGEREGEDRPVHDNGSR